MYQTIVNSADVKAAVLEFTGVGIQVLHTDDGLDADGTRIGHS
jgi:hypothetical protein